jgi:hypothetical protein
MRRDERAVASCSRAAVAAMVLTGVMAVTPAVYAQQTPPELPQLSPAARVDQRVGLTDFSVKYSSPAVKDRKIWGDLVPYDKLWRTGANAATTLQASRDFRFGGTPVPAGTYSLHTIPGKSSWQVILNGNPTASSNDYDPTKDVARVTVKAGSAPYRERLVFLFSDTTDDTTSLDIEWEKRRVSIPIAVDTATQAMANIDATLNDSWRPHWASARYLLDNNGDLNRALQLIDTSIQIKGVWWNHWVRAQILAKQGKRADAIAAGEQAQRLGAGDRVYDGFFKDQIATTMAGWKKKGS